MRKLLSSFIIFLSLAYSIPKAHAKQEFLGVKASDEEKYSFKHFDCIDGKRRLQISQVNDDYCDCADGSDEPGTSACSGVVRSALFACRPQGYPEVLIPSSRVADGVCDCCDGSDELLSSTKIKQPKAKCKNQCKEVYAAEMERLQRLAAEFSEGRAERERYVLIGQQAQARRRDTLEHAKETVKSKEGYISTLKEAVQSEQAAELIQRLGGVQETLGFDQLSDSAVLSLVSNFTIEVGNYEELFHIAILQEVANSPGLSEEELAKRVEEREKKLTELGYPANLEEISNEEQLSLATQALALKDSLNMRYLALVFLAHSMQSTTLYQLLQQLSGNPPETCADTPESLSEESVSAPSCADKQTVVIQSIEESLNHLIASVEIESELKKTYDKAKAELDKFEKEVSELEEEIKLEPLFGDDQQFYLLFQSCWTTKKDETEYEICPFKSVTQRTESDSFDLGTFKKFEKVSSPHGAYKMKFKDGQQCWNGPKRASTVFFDCGLEDKIIAADEPSMCEYEFVLKTPSACDQLQA